MKKIHAYTHLIREAMKDDGENLPVIFLVFRSIFWLLKYRDGLRSFFLLHMHKKGSSMRSVMTDRHFLDFDNKLNPLYYRVILEDKFVFDRFLRSFHVPMAELRGLIENGSIRWLKDEQTESLDNLVNYNLNCFAKMITNWGGNQVYKIEIQDKSVKINNRLSSIGELKDTLSGKIYLLQDTVTQHPDLDRLNPSCVNTIRMITIHNGTQVENFHNYLRTGVNESVVDNISSGGLGCPVYDDGRLFSKAVCLYGNHIWITHHPQSGVAFKDFQIPFYREALSLVIRMHERFHCFFTISWDIVITESGPLVLEANPMGGIMYVQYCFGGVKDIILDYSRKFEKSKSSLLN